MTRSTGAGHAAPTRRPAALVLALVALLALLALLFAATSAPAAATPSARTGASRAGLHDPALRMGTLPNGLRYYVRHNASPAGRAELRLVVNAGSMQEDADQRGMAHFLEHMAFNGTRHFPAQSLIDFVEASGMRFGADLNAYTSFDETVYMLTVPTDEAQFLEQGLTVLEDWASGGILIDSAEVVAERGVVLGEWRSRLPDTTSQKFQRHQREILFGEDSRYLDRLPIGEPEGLDTAFAAPVRRFYEEWYRPDLMAVVVVGDVDADAIEQEIVARFGGIAGPKRARTREPGRVRAAPEGVVDVHRAPFTPSVQVVWPVPSAPSEPRAYIERQLVERILLQALERRFLRMRELDSRPFVSATVQRGRLARPLDLVGFSMIAWPDSLERSLATAAAEIERIAQHGIPEADLARERAALLAQFERSAASAVARASVAYADEYVRDYLTGDALLLSAAQELAIAREVLPTITAERLASAARFWRSPEGRTVMFSLPELAHTRPPTRESVEAIFDSLMRTTLAPPETRAVAEGPLLERAPTAGQVTRETVHEAAGITEWTLSNGARVLFKPSTNDPDELLIRAWSPGGFSRVPDSLFYSSGRMVARMMTEAAGLGDRDRDDLTARLESSGLRGFAVDIGYGDESIALAGSPSELEMLVQLLHLQFTAPRLDSAALAAWKNWAKYQGRAFSIFDQLAQTFARGNARMMPVSTQLADIARLDEAMAVYRDRFGNAGDFTFTIVGAATAEQVKPLVERYLASLPATAERETPKDPKVRPFFMRVSNTVRPFDVPKASTVLVFDGAFPTDDPDAYLAERQRLATLSDVLTRRLRTRLREELSATYGVAVIDRTYPLPDEHYQMLFSFDAAPDRMRSMQREMRAILDAVRDSGATAAELARAQAAQRRQLETRLQDNDYWMERIGLFTRLGLPLDRIVDPYVEGIVTPSELAEAARRFLPDDVYIQITALPSESLMENLEKAEADSGATEAAGPSGRDAGSIRQADTNEEDGMHPMQSDASDPHSLMPERRRGGRRPVRGGADHDRRYAPAG